DAKHHAAILRVNRVQGSKFKVQEGAGCGWHRGCGIGQRTRGCAQAFDDVAPKGLTTYYRLQRRTVRESAALRVSRARPHLLPRDVPRDRHAKRGAITVPGVPARSW